MNGNESRVEQLLLQLKDVAEQIAALPFKGEDYDRQLELLQSEQARLRKQIDGEKQGSAYSERQLDLLRQCLELEQANHAKIAAHKEDLGARLDKLHSAARVKSGYHRAYIQAEGYFIDKLK